MPNRILRDGILDSETVNSLPEEAELFYRRLMSIVDDYGRCEAKPEVLRVKLFGLRLKDWPASRVQKCLSLVSQVSDTCLTDDGQMTALVSHYEVNGRKYLQINNFRQRTRSDSKFPAPNDGHVTVTCQTNDRLDGGGGVVGGGDEGVTPQPPKGGSVVTDEDFESWWETYPRRIKKSSAREAFNKLIALGKSSKPTLSVELKKLSAEERLDRLISGMPGWNAEWSRRESMSYVPHPTSFLNSGDWLEPPELPKEATKAPSRQPDRMSWMSDDYYRRLCAGEVSL